MFFKKITNYIYETEILEFNIKDQLDSVKQNKKTLLINLLLKKFIRSLYRSLQRYFIKPSTRNNIIGLENNIFNFFNKKKILSNKKYEVLNNVSSLKKDSYTIIENIFSENEINSIKNYLNSKKDLVDIYESSTGKRMNMKYYKTEDLVANELILKGANNSNIKNILSDYFGCNFKLDWIWSWWSYAEKNSNSIGPQLFHRDYESFNFLKVFVYLTDVVGNDGSHQLVAGSHCENKLYNIKRFSDEEILKNFDEKKIVNLDGKSGKTFIANTFAIHRGFKPFQTDRLILCYLFSVVPSRRSPKLPVINFSNLKSDKDLFKENEYMNSLFIDFNK